MTHSDTEQIRFDVLLAEGFVLTEYAAVVDQLRLANRVLLKPLFEWRILSAKGGAVMCRAEAWVETDAVRSVAGRTLRLCSGQYRSGVPGVCRWGG